MQVTVFGASGKIGKRVVQLLLDDGNDVVAFVHRSSLQVTHDRLRLVHGDIHNYDEVREALRGSSAVICTLSSWHASAKDVLSTAVAALILAMNELSIRRIISLTGSDAQADFDQPKSTQRIMHALFASIAPKIISDSEQHLRLLGASNLDWTVIRSPLMRNFGRAGVARLTMKAPPPWASVHRSDVAAAIIRVLHDNNYVHSAPFVHTRRYIL